MILPEHVLRLLSMLENAGYESYVVGGCVRDCLMGRTPHDYDITTIASPEQVKEVFQDYRVENTGLQHGTVTVYAGHTSYEVTTFRTEGPYTDGRRPDYVAFVGNLQEDLARRDLTVNAMAYSPVRGLIDPFGGQKHLSQKIIQAVGNPRERFQEDHLRILRAVRFASTLSENPCAGAFTIEKKTAEAIHEMAGLLATVAKERVTAEMTKLLAGVNVKNVMLDFPDIFTAIFPQLSPMMKQVQHHPWHKYNLWEHTAAVVAGVPEKTETLLWAALLHDCGKPSSVVTKSVESLSDKKKASYDLETYPFSDVTQFKFHASTGACLAEQILLQTALSSRVQEDVVFLIRNHHSFPGENAKSVRRWVGRHGEERCTALIQLREADAKGFSSFGEAQAMRDMQVLRASFQAVKDGPVPYKLNQLAVNGNDLLAAGLKQGPLMGVILHQLLDEVMNERLENDKSALCRRALDIWEAKSHV